MTEDKFYHPENEPTSQELFYQDVRKKLRHSITALAGLTLLASIPCAVLVQQALENPHVECTETLRGNVRIIITRLQDDDGVQVYKVDGLPECYEYWLKYADGDLLGWGTHEYRSQNSKDVVGITIIGNDGTRLPVQPLDLTKLVRPDYSTNVDFIFTPK